MIKPNTCPYCGGPYTIEQTCNGPRTDAPGENACPDMQRHTAIVQALIDSDENAEPPQRR